MVRRSIDNSRSRTCNNDILALDTLITPVRLNKVSQPATFTAKYENNDGTHLADTADHSLKCKLIDVTTYHLSPPREYVPLSDNSIDNRIYHDMFEYKWCCCAYVSHVHLDTMDDRTVVAKTD